MHKKDGIFSIDELELYDFILIYAGNFHQFAQYCRVKNFNRHDQRIIYIESIQSLRGQDLNRCRIIFTGTHYNRNDHFEIEQYIISCNGKIIKDYF